VGYDGMRAQHEEIVVKNPINGKTRSIEADPRNTFHPK
jgi:hypothetical protein